MTSRSGWTRSSLRAWGGVRRDAGRYRADRGGSVDPGCPPSCVCGPVHLRSRGRERLLVPSPVVTEVCYMVAREAGARGEAAFLTSLAEGDLDVVDLDRDDWRRTAEVAYPFHRQGTSGA